MVTWSSTALDSFEQCPRRYKLTRVTKEVKEEQTEATRHGNEVHKALEQAIKGQQVLPTKFSHFQPIVQRCTRAQGEHLVEYRFALNAAFKPTDYWAKDVWVRGVLDFTVVRGDRAVTIDWKTGKIKPASDQLKLFAAALMSYRPYIVRVETGFAWLAHGRMTRETFTRDQLPDIWGEFLPRVRRMETAVVRDDFPPKPSGLCKAWCPVPKRLCEFSGRT